MIRVKEYQILKPNYNENDFVGQSFSFFYEIKVIYLILCLNCKVTHGIHTAITKKAYKTHMEINRLQTPAAGNLINWMPLICRVVKEFMSHLIILFIHHC